MHFYPDEDYCDCSDREKGHFCCARCYEQYYNDDLGAWMERVIELDFDGVEPQFGEVAA
jgi:hypothetical protein